MAVLEISYFAVAALATFAFSLFMIPRLRKAGIVGRDVNKPGQPKVAEMGGITIVAGFLFMGISAMNRGEALSMDQHTWSAQEKAVLRSLWLGSLDPLPVDPSNKYSDNPKAAALGRKFFFEDHFSGNMKVSCATCHRPQHGFAPGARWGSGPGPALMRRRSGAG